LGSEKLEQITMKPISSSQHVAEALVRASHHWMTRSSEAQSASRRSFTIAISREAGTRGPTIARVIGDKLGWPVYDHELLQVIADQTGMHVRLLESVDEEHRSWVQELVDEFASPGVSESKYVRHLLQMLFTLASHGRCVIVGRGAPQLLPSESTLRVRLIAPVDERIRNSEKTLGLSREDANRWIEKIDSERTRFIKANFHKDPADPHQYDLVLNPSRFSTEQCAELIVEALHRLQAHVPAHATEPLVAMNV
jgi:cytidylate kinase